MRILIKTVTLMISLSLLFPNISLAQETLNKQIPLQELQQKARLDADMLKEVGIPLLATASTVGLLVTVRQIIKQKTEIKELTNQLKEIKAPVSPAPEVASAAPVVEIEKLQKRLKSQREYYEYIIGLREKEAQTLQERAIKQQSAAENYIAGSVSASERESAFLDKCADLLLETNPKEQAIYRDAIYHDRVFTRMSATEQAKFRSTLEELVRAVRAHQPLNAETYQVLGRMILQDANIPVTQRLARGIGSALIKKSSSAVFVVALLTIGVVTANAAENQKGSVQKANRIFTNINLFLKATPEQLEEMQADPIIRQACQQVTESLDVLAHHTTAEELVAFKQLYLKQSLQQVQKQPIAR